MIQVFKPHLRLNDIYSVLRTLLKNNISGTSPVVQEFEYKLAKKFDRKYAVAVSNGSVALDLVFQTLDLNEDDEVILPSFTIISCLAAVIRSKAKPVFCDVDPETWNMTLDNIKIKYTNKTKAVLMVHTYGLPADAVNISNFCEEKNLILIEDAAEAHGQSIENLRCGSFVLISTFSFYSNKHITTGEGGAILTDSEEVYKLAKQMRNLDFTPKQRFKHQNLYWNYRIGGMQAALGVSQLKNIDKVIKNKIKQGNYYLELLKDETNRIQLPIKEINNIQNHYWVFGIMLKKDGIRDLIMESLEKRNIETRPFFWPLHLQDYILNDNSTNIEALPTTENLGKNGFYLPMGEHVNKKLQEKIVNELVASLNDL